MFGLNRAVAPRETKSQAELAIAKVQIKGSLEHPPPAVLQYLPIPTITGSDPEYKAAYVHEKIRTEILHLPPAYFVNAVMQEIEEKPQEMISSASEESF